MCTFNKLSSKVYLPGKLVVSALLLFISFQTLAKEFDTGVFMTPRSFPFQDSADVIDMFDKAVNSGQTAVFGFEWKNEDALESAPNLFTLSNNKGLAVSVNLDIIDGKGDDAHWMPPSALDEKGSFGNKAFADNYKQYVKALAELQPQYLIAAVDVNRMANVSPKEYKNFIKVYISAYKMVKKIAPQTKVMVSFQWELLRKQIDAGQTIEAKKQIDAFLPYLDGIAISSMPFNAFKSPDEIPESYYRDLVNLTKPGSQVILSTGWTADDSEQQQLNFVKKLPNLLKDTQVDLLVWPSLHDIRLLGFLSLGPFANLGLFDDDGEPKLAYAAFKNLHRSTDQRASTEANKVKILLRKEDSRVVANDRFGIYSSRLDGSDLKLILSDPEREINHARVSPDRQWITFTRYNKRGPKGDALEIYGYGRTEIMVMRLDGSEVQSLVVPRPGIVAANSYWTPDGTGILFVSNDNAGHIAKINLIDWRSKAVKKIPMPKDFTAADPHQVKRQIVFPMHRDKQDKFSSLWLMGENGTNPRQLTKPEFDNYRKDRNPLLGDHDPKLSPDGLSVACMRHMGEDNWHIIVVDVKTGKEQDLSKPTAVDAVPEWSSDGKLLLFWHVNKSRLQDNGLYTMDARGNNRRRVPLPKTFFYTMPAFFPNSGSGADAQIIFTARQQGD